MFALQKYKEISFILRHSITKQLLVVVFSVYLILTVLVTLFHMRFEYDSSKHQTIEALKNLQEMIRGSIGQAIWEFNTTQLDAILKGLYTNQFLVGVKLKIAQNSAIPELTDQSIGLVDNEAGELIFYDPETKAAKIIENTFERLIPDQFNIYHVDSFNHKQLIGTMCLYSSNKVVFNQVKDSFILLIINAIIKTVGLWVLFLWSGYYYISMPLIQLTKAIKKLAMGDWATALKSTISKGKSKTEINTLFETFNDMTHQLYKTQDKLEQSKNRLADIFDTMPSALISINKHGIIQGWNKYISIETNIEAKDAIGHKIVEIYPAFEEYFKLIDDSLNNNQEYQVNHAKLVSNSEDQHRLFNIAVYPIKSATNHEVVIRIDDVTEQVKNETELAQVEKLASVGASIAGVAHEINNPLGSIMQSTQNIIRRLDPTLEANKAAADELKLDLSLQYKYLEKREILSFLESMREAGERASSIVKNMLKFTRRSTDDMSKHDLVEIINDGIQLAASDFSLQSRIDFKKIHLVKNLYAEHVEIECFPMEIQQVILNLLKNAAHALETKTGTKEITIDLILQDPEKVCLTIGDNGHGMSDEIKKKIFQPFFTTKPAGIGTGLGLSICKNIIVQKHHGLMEVESIENVGTKFILTLPITQHL